SRIPSTRPRPPPPPVSPKRPQCASPTQYAGKVQKAALECVEPPLNRTQQVAANADIVSEKLLDDLLEDTAQELWSMEWPERLQTEALPMTDTHSLESMLQRMDEIERYQESVRRRFTQIKYSDLEFWAQQDTVEEQIAKRPTSPHPIQITRLNVITEPEMDILFEKPFNGNDVGENEPREKLQTGNDIQQPFTLNSLQKDCYVSLSVPQHMLHSILDYNNRYSHHLKLISHEVVGSFNPWQIA
ncbi:MOONR protein, partial [Heliornis fulica]|nr:MOONR protein [Heliornis fulica]